MTWRLRQEHLIKKDRLEEPAITPEAIAWGLDAARISNQIRDDISAECARNGQPDVLDEFHAEAIRDFARAY